MLVTQANKEFKVFLPAGLVLPDFGLGDCLSGIQGLFGLGVASWGRGGGVGCL